VQHVGLGQVDLLVRLAQQVEQHLEEGLELYRVVVAQHVEPLN
jgi:hypothetical protein